MAKAKKIKKFSTFKYRNVTMVALVAVVAGLATVITGAVIKSSGAATYTSTWYDYRNEYYHSSSSLSGIYYYTGTRTIQENLQSVFVKFYYARNTSTGSTPLNATSGYNCANFRVRFFVANGTQQVTGWKRACSNFAATPPSVTLATQILKYTRYRVEAQALEYYNGAWSYAPSYVPYYALYD